MNKIRQTKITKSARGETCTLRQLGCKWDSETVVLCHLNTPFKGMAIKSPDIFAVYGCHNCHQLLDSGKVSKADQLHALFLTQKKLMDKGLIKIG